MIIAGTGHRPQFCPCKFKKDHPWLVSLKEDLKKDLAEKIDKIEKVNTGMAIGWDMWLAEVALELDIKLHAYVPFPGQPDKWPPPTVKVYNNILNKCEKVHQTADNYYPKVFLDRDADLIEDATHVYSLLNPEADSGGTFHTVGLAMKSRKIIKDFWREDG